MRSLTRWNGQMRLTAGSIPRDRLRIGALLAFGALHLAAVLLSHSARNLLAPRFNLLIGAAFLGIIVIGTVSVTLLTALLVALPAIQLGTALAAGMSFDPSVVFGATLSIGLLLRLSSEEATTRFAWTGTGRISLWTITAALTAIILSSIANSQSLSNCIPWFVAGSVALSLILSARLGYLKSSSIPIALLIGFAITATSDLRLYLRGTAIDTGANAGRFVGGMGDYELLGEFYAVAIVIALATLVHVRRLAVILLALYVIGLGLILVFATHTRSAVILLAIALPLLLIAPAIGRSVYKTRLVLIISVAATLLAGLTPLISSSNTVSRLSSIVNTGDFARTINRSSVWPFIVSDPKFRSSGLFGNGPVGVWEWFGELWPHNLVLWTIWSLGIMGCVFIALLAATGISGIVQWRKHGWVTVALGFSLVFLLADEIVVEFPRKGSMISFILALCALVGAASIAERSEKLGRTAG